MGILICAVGLTTILGFNTGFAFDLFSKAIVDESLTSVSFHRGGDMQGSTHGLSIKAIDNNSALVCYEDAKWHFEAIDVKEYIVPITVLEDVKNIFNKNQLLRCEKAPKSKFRVLDGATSSYSFNFDKKRVYFSSTQELQNEQYEALREIKRCISDACQKGQRLPGLVLQLDADGNLPKRNAVSKGVVAIKVVGYKNNILHIAIGNGLEQEKIINPHAKLVNALNPGVVVAEKNSEAPLNLPKYYNEDYSWKLGKRLVPGKYILELGGYTTEFEIK